MNAYTQGGVCKLGCYVLGPNDTAENGIYCGDARGLVEAIPDESVDLIFTDPPYARKHLPLYSWLSEMAERVLKPGGFCLALCGGLCLNQVFKAMDRHLDFFWLYDFELTGQAAAIIWPYGSQGVTIINRVRRVVAYSKGKAIPRASTLTLYKGSGEDKRYHVWGQDELSARYYLDCFTAPGDIVFDPLCGGGVVPAMCKVLERPWLGFDSDESACKKAREHIARAQPFLPMPLAQQLELDGV